ncbi:hypothetical protein [Clostridium sp. AF32-12BH]|uniref:hypothetical protein n=1 Tax=Clostridium sp. AF32-12BH TaxID=2292006 RepID=UPI000E548DEB|nr:hypothetical protein [Clostridium sp. AF32-12BH]
MVTLITFAWKQSFSYTGLERTEISSSVLLREEEGWSVSLSEGWKSNRDRITEGGGNVCCKAIKDMIESKEKENTINLYKNGVSIEIIAKSLSLPIEKIRSWILSAGLQIL